MMVDEDRPPLLSRLLAEERLVAGGVEESAARRFGAWLALAGVPLDGRSSLDEMLFAIDPARLGPEALHAHVLLLGMRARQGAHALYPRLITSCEALVNVGANEARLRAMMGRAEVPSGRRDELLLAVPRSVVSFLRASMGTEEGLHATEALRQLAAGGEPGLAAAASSALGAASARAIEDFEVRVRQLDVGHGDLDVPHTEEIAVFMAAQDADRRLGGDARLRRIVVSAILPVAWRRYTARKWEDLRALLATVEALTDGLATELEAHPDDLAYRAAVSQVLVFRAEVALTASLQIDLAERALALCPTLRNARVVLASQLVARARRTPEPRLAERDLERAHALDPFHPEFVDRPRKASG